MHFRNKNLNISKYLQYLLMFLIVFNTKNSFSQKGEKEKKIIHSYGIGFNNNIYFPERTFNEKGLIKRKKNFRYGYEFNINYNIIFKNNFGIKAGLLIFGSIPEGFKFNFPGDLDDEFTWGNGKTTENPFDGPALATSAFITGLTYHGFDVMLNYSYKINKIIVQPEIGARFMYIPTYGKQGTSEYCFDNIDCILFHYEYANNLNNERDFYPDLVFNLNILLPIKANHHLKIGASFNYGFVPRMEGYYELVNIGKYNSTGNMEYGSTYFGFNVGYQFLGLEKKMKTKNKKKILFNPRY